MGWPDINDYNEALQNLAATCGDPLLKQCEPVRNPLGLLLPYAGGFADVYAVTSPDGRKWAVKCFKKHRPELHERYEKIDAHLKSVKLPFTVPFAYVTQGLRIRGEWYPIVRMEWVEGLRLNDFVAESFEKPQMLDQLAELWPKVAQRLQAANLAHADLQHGNVLLVPRGEDGSLSLKLIDYDGMYVPAFAGQRSGELGHGCFQHPQRLREKIFTADVDRFSHLVIYTALRCLRAAGKDLWQRFENGDNLLFRESDFVSPAKSPLLGELWRINHPAAHAMTGRLILATQQPLAAAPWLHEVVQGREVKPLTPQEEGRVREVLGQAAPAKSPASAETLETAAPGTRPGTQPAPAAGSRPGGTTPAPGTGAAGGAAPGVKRPANPLNPLGAPQGDLLKPREPDEPAEEPLGPILWKLYRENLLLANAGIVGALTLLILVGAMLFSGGGNDDPSQTANTTPPPSEGSTSAGGGATPPVNFDFRLQRKIVKEGIGPGYGFALSPDGRFVAWEGLVWDVASGARVTALATGRVGSPRSTAFSPDGTLVAAAGASERTVLLFSTANWEQAGALQDSTGYSLALCFSPDGRLLASGGDDGRIQVWNVADQSLTATLGGPGLGTVHALTFSPDGGVLAACSHDSLIRLWDLSTGEVRHKLAGHENDALAVTFSADGQTLVSAGADQTIRYWDVATGASTRTLPGHSNAVRGLSISPDQRILASASLDNSIKLWDFQTGQLLQTLDGHVDRAYEVAFHPNGTMLFSAGGDRTILVWEKSGPAEASPADDAAPSPFPQYQLARTLPGHEAPVSAAAFSPDGALLATSGADPTVRLWDAASGAPRQVFDNPLSRDSVLSVAFSPDRQTLVVGRSAALELWNLPRGELDQSLTVDAGSTGDLAFSPSGLLLAARAAGTAQLWHLPSRSQRYALTGQGTDVTAVAVGSDGQTLIAGCGSGEVVVFNLTTGDPTLQISPRLPGEVRALACLPNSPVFAAAGDDGQIYFWDYTTGNSLGTLSAQAGAIVELVYRPDGRVLASLGEDGALKLWDTTTAQLRQEIALGVDNRALAFSPDGLLLVTSDGNTNSAVVWALPAGAEQADSALAAAPPEPSPPALPQFQEVATQHLNAQRLSAVAFSPDGRTLAVGCEDSDLRLLNGRTGALERTVPGHSMWVSSVAFSPDGSRMATGSLDQMVQVRELPSTDFLLTLPGHTNWVNSVAFSPDGQTIASASRDASICLWNAATGELRQTLRSGAGAGPVEAVAFSPDGSLLASCSEFGEVYLWNVAAGEFQHVLVEHAGAVHNVAFSANGQTLYSGGDDGNIFAWDVQTGQRAAFAQSLSKSVMALACSPDGRLIAAGGDDRVVKLWDTADGELVQSLTAHTDRIDSLAFSPDGTRLASASYDGSIKLWARDAEPDSETLVDPFGSDPPGAPGPRPRPGPAPDPVVSTEPLPQFQAAETLERHTEYVFALAFSPDGRQLASGGADAALNLWDARGATFERAAGFHGRPIFTAAYSPDGLLLASGDDNGVLSLWNTQTSAERETTARHDGRILDVAFSPDGSRLASCSEDRTVRLWDPSTGEPLFVLRGHNLPVRSVAFSPDGQTLASSSADGEIRWWSVADGQLVRALAAHAQDCWSIAYSPDGETLASASADQTIKLWNAATGELRRTLQEHTDRVFAVAYSPDGRLLASGSADGTVRLWNAATGELSQTLVGHQAGVFALAFSPDGATLASSGYETTIRFWRAAGAPATPVEVPGGAPGPPALAGLTFQEAQRIRVHTNAVRGLAFFDGGQTLVSAGVDSNVNFLEPATGEVRSSTDTVAPIAAVAANPAGDLVATGDDTGIVRLFHSGGIESGSLLGDHDGTIWALAFSPDGTHLATVGEDRTLQVWDVAEREQLFRAELHRGPVLSVAYSPDGATLATGSEDHTIILWDAADGKALNSLTDHTNDVTCVAFSPDGQTLASASKDRTIRLWDAATWTVRQTLEGHKAPVLVVAYSPDGRWLASGGGDDDVLLWDAATGALVQTLKGHDSTVFALAFSPDGRTLASGSLDRSIIVWQSGVAAAAAPAGAAPPLPPGAAAPVSPGRQKGLFDGRLGPKGAEEFQALAAAQLGLPPSVATALGLQLQLIPAGRFSMGSPAGETDRKADEQQHDVVLTRPFYLGATEVTRGQFEQFFPNWESEKLGPLAGHENDAQTMTSWADACAFCNALSEREGLPAYYTLDGQQVTAVGGLGYRLPTEAEMEYVCRCGTTTPYYAAHDFQEISAYRADASLPHAVALARPNAWGLYDLYGGVWEWCADWYDAQYFDSAPREDPPGPASGSAHVLRGGCSAANGEWMRCAARNNSGAPYERQNSIGFRVARTIYE